MYTPGVSLSSAKFNLEPWSLEKCPMNNFFTIETLRLTNRTNRFFLKTNFRFFTLSKRNYLYLKMALILSCDINLNLRLAC